MSKTVPEHADGSRDCGRFFLDAVGRYGRDGVLTEWLEAPRLLPESLRRKIDKTWDEQVHRAAAAHVDLHDGPLCRLVGFAAGKKQLTLTLGPTSYKEFLGTNLTESKMRYVHGEEVLANPLGVSAAVTTADGFLVLGRRSARVYSHPGRIHPIGGMVDRKAGATKPPDVFAAILRELHEETNVSADLVDEIVCLGLVRDKAIVQPELVFDVALRADAPTMRRLAKKAPDSAEHDSLVLLMNNSSSVVTFMEKHAEVLTPVATAALLLHGLRSWGSGWFASARGYLRSVV